MKHFPAITLAAALFASGAAWADSDCHQPMAQWQPREAVSAHVLERGITTDRLRIDDGCYEVRGRDGDGNSVELKLDPASLEVMTMFRKPEAFNCPVVPKYVGFDLPDEFVVGYGLDYAGRYRNLRDVATLAPHVYG